MTESAPASGARLLPADEAFGDTHGVLMGIDAVVAPIYPDGSLQPLPGTVALLQRIRNAGLPAGVIAPDRDAHQLLVRASLSDLVDVIVDATTIEDVRATGGPHASPLRQAVRRMGVTSERTVVIDTTVAGVEDAKREGFGLVVGIDRFEPRAELEAAGADLVVHDVSELDLGASRTDPWVLGYRGFDPAHEGHREALTTLGNGWMGTRGARPEHSDDGTHYPGTYLAGIYNRLESTIHGRALAEEHLVNAPNWLPLDLRMEDGAWWSSGAVAASEERHHLHLHDAVSIRRVILHGPDAGRLSVIQRAVVSMGDPHLAMQETTVTPIGWSGRVTFRAGIDAGVRNTNVSSYVGSDSTHLAEPTFRVEGPVLLCEVETRQSGIRIATAAHMTVRGTDVIPTRKVIASGRRHEFEFDLSVGDGKPVTLMKVAATFTSRDTAISSPGDEAVDRVRDAASRIDELRDRHGAAWRLLWARFAVTLEADLLSQLVLNLHIFHLLQAISPHTAEADAGVPARGLHGEGYRGHIFWDEVFVLPVIGLRLPEVAEALLDYRWRRLPAARRAARRTGRDGALFPWQSGSDGREETPALLYNSRSTRWMPDNSRRQRHVGLAIAWNAWQHFQVTGDVEWLTRRGAELMVEVTRYFVSLAEFDADDGRYHISGVMGPDEYHDGYPDAPGSGLRDNTYTNVMVSWLCARTCEALDVLEGHFRGELEERLGVRDDEIAKWADVGARLAVSRHADGILSQFDGYENLAELDWARYRARYGNIGRLDLILEAEADSTNRYKAAKQPDVVMLVYLLGMDGLRGQLEHLGFRFTDEDVVRTVEYYSSRTSHGSTLSRVVHASVLAGLDADRGWELFREALIADLDDTQWGTTREGIHLGAMAGTIDIVMRSFAGLRVTEGELHFSPRLPARLRRAGFQFAYRGHRVDVQVTPGCVELSLQPSRAAALRVRVGEATAALKGGERHEFLIASAGSVPESRQRRTP
ncbi:putative glycosyl hydrolase [Agromyces sp. NDB4Y10]|uniref:glycosyl hydrolase family 65 protein n=1 Tax=Agromyces sp. NDB4Y10 TaxID=1775951 RepID=UPI0007B17E5F|nr:glycosyl hydrolase family 65 protein [Agromyces sp. NDB4Y10]KZE92420.1 putative glycosyl hydrolase [Agromyces sp. NDB4Y10]